MKKLTMLLAAAAAIYFVITRRARPEALSRTGRDGLARQDLDADDLSSHDELRVDVSVDDLEIASDINARTGEVLDEDSANEEGQTWLEHLEQVSGENGPRSERPLDMSDDRDGAPRSSERDLPVADLGVAGPRGL